MKKKKICILSNGLWRGGTDTFVVNLVKGLDKEKYDITVVLSISDDWLAIRESEVIKAGAKTVRTCGITGKGLNGRLKHLFLLYRCLKEEKPDVFQTNIDLFNGPNLFVAWLVGVKVRICHSHNSMQEREADGGRNIAIAIYQGLMRWMCWRFSNRRAGCSEAALNFLFKNKWKTDNRAIVVNNGIDIERFRTSINVETKKIELGLQKKFNILTVGRLSTQKNPLMIAKCFTELCGKRNDCDLIWVGIGEMEEQLKLYLNERKVIHRAHFLGTRDDIHELMQISDVFLFPSLFEGLGIVLIEAQAAGLPCLVSDTVPQMVDCGGCEFLSIQKSPSVWAEHMSRILDGGKQFVIQEETLQEYSIEHMVQQMESLFV